MIDLNYLGVIFAILAGFGSLGMIIFRAGRLLQKQFGELGERIARVETNVGLLANQKIEIEDLKRQISVVRENVARIEGRLDPGTQAGSNE